MSDESNHCCCGHDHDDSCDNHNESQCGKNDGCNGTCHDGGCHDRVIYITEEEKTFITKLSQLPFLPLARFVMKSSKSEHMESVALAPVYMQDKGDSMEAVKKTGDVLRSLEEKYIITLDYDMPLQNGDYSLYEESELYHIFCSTVQEGAKQGGFIFDLPVLERGSMALTALGQDAVDSLA